LSCLCGADPCICETPDITRSWEMLESWAALNEAAQRKRLAERRYQPPPCDFPEDD